MNEEELIEQVFENAEKKLRSDQVQIETAALNAQAAALERLTESRNRHTEALEREAKALRELEDAKRSTLRKPPQIVHSRDQRDRRAEEIRKANRG